MKPANRQKFMNYMIANRLKNLLEVIDEFWGIQVFLICNLYNYLLPIYH
jgi:hypothetical protein